MKTYLLFTLCFILMSAASNAEHFEHNNYSIGEILLQLKVQPHKIYNQLSATFAYFVPVPKELGIEKYISYDDDNQIWYYQLLEYGYVPVFQESGTLVGFYVEADFDGENTSAFNYATYNFEICNLKPIYNNKNQVVAVSEGELLQDEDYLNFKPDQI